MQKYILFSFLLLLTLLLACAHVRTDDQPVDLIRVCYHAGKKLANRLDETGVRDTPVVITTFADLDELAHSSSLGRLLPHQIASALRERSYRLVDVRLRSQDLLIQQKNGEFILSRDIERLEPGLRSALFLLGTYSRIADTVYINAKIVSSRDGIVLAATDFMVPREYLGATVQPGENKPALRPSVRTAPPAP